MDENAGKERLMLLKILKTARSYIHDLTRINDKIAKLKTQVKNEKKEHDSRISKNTEKAKNILSHAGGILGLAGLLASAPALLLELKYPLANAICLTILAACISTIPLFFLVKAAIVRIEKTKWDTVTAPQLQQWEREIEKNEKKKEAVLNDEARNVLSVLPPDYIYPDALDFFVKAFENYRADTMKEAVNLYEEHLYRLRMEAGQKKLLKYQKYLSQLQEENQLLLASLQGRLDQISANTYRTSRDLSFLATLASIEYPPQS